MNEEKELESRLKECATLEEKLFDLFGAYTIIRNGTRIYSYPGLSKDEYQPSEISINNQKEIIERITKLISQKYVRRDRVDISDKDLGQIVMFIRRSMFLPENQKLEELRQMILKAIATSPEVIKEREK